MPEIPTPPLADSFADLWRAGPPVPDVWSFLRSHPHADPAAVVAVLLADQWRRHEVGCPRPVEDYLAAVPTVATDPERKLDLVYGEYRSARQFGPPPDPSAFAARFPDLADALARHLALDDALTPAAEMPEDTVAFEHTGGPRADSDSAHPLGGIGPGTRLGRYELLRLLGAGGMGEVFLARDTLLGRNVAVKILPARWANEPGRLARFAREARALAALTHPHILTIFDFGTAPDTVYAVTELLVGQTVQDRLRGGPLAWAEAVAIARATAEGLNAAHASGIVHRDIKPGNLFLGPGGVKILDFGLVAYAAAGDSPPTADTVTYDKPLTAEGVMMGTPGYMSPEQVCGTPTDVRTDVFALGYVLHEMLAGTAPFRRPTAVATIAATLRDPPPELPPDVPGWLARVVERCLAKDRADRYDSASQLVVALASAEAAGTDRVERGKTAAVAPPPAPDPDARRLYLRARFHFEKRTEAEFDVARELYREALAVNPDYAAAYTGLADLHFTLGGWGMVPPHATFPVARQLAEKAISLDPRSADAWAILGYVRAVFDWDWAASDAAMRRALAIQPEHQSANVKHSYLRLLRGQYREALTGMKAACERDPLSVVVRTNVGAAFYYLKQFDEARTEFQTALTMNPKYPSAHWYVGLVHLGMGSPHRAVAAFEKAVEFSGGLAGDVCALCHALAVSGRTAEAEGVLAKLTAAAERRYIPPFFFALAHLTLGRPTEGYNFLDAALAERDYYLVNLRIDSRFDPFRADPRFARIAAAVQTPDGAVGID